MKKVFKIFGILLLLLIVAIIAVPFLFKGTIQDKVLYQINQHVNAKVDLDNLDISLIRSFPRASIVIDEFSMTNHAPFEGDTLAYAKRIALNMSVMELFKDPSEPISLQKIIIDEASIAIKTDSLGNSNMDVTKKDDSVDAVQEKDTEEGEAFTFALEHYEINDSKILFRDDVTKMMLEMTHFSHSGDGSVGEKIILDTQTETEASFVFDGTNYLNKNKLKLDAEIELDLENQKYIFKENTFQINRLPLEFTGFVQLADAYTDVDLSFKTPTSDFKNFLAVIPEVYTKDLSGVKTNGDFSISGTVKGKSDEKYIPKMDINILANNAYFKYPDLPKAVENININTQIVNETGLLDDTFVKINDLTFKIDQDAFAAKGSLLNVTKNMIVDMTMNGTLNLANLNQAYPMELEQKLNGILTANIATHFDMESLDKEQYQNVKSSGIASISKFVYASEDLPNEIKIETANVSFNPETITLDNMDVTTGRSDLQAKGTIQNLMGFVFSEQDLKGEFDVASTVFAVDDFMVGESESEETTQGESENKTVATTDDDAMKIPSFLDATLNFDTETVFYDNLELKNTKGTVKIKDETAYLENVTSNIFDGNIGFSGNVSTKSETPTFDMALDLDKIDIVQSFTNLELIKSLAPIAQALTGNITTQMKLNGNLDESLIPVLTSLKGSALAEILNAQVSTTKTPMLSSLDNQLNFVDIDQLNLKDIKTNLSFDDGKINVEPFEFDVQGIKITAGGDHSFDQNMNYTMTLDVPAKYLGDEVGSLISQLDPKEADAMTVGVPVGISGNFKNPKINLNTRDAIKQLTQQIVAKQKEKVKGELVGQGQKVLTDLLGGGSKNEEGDSNTTEATDTKETLKNTAKNILGGFLSKKKADTTKNN
ncbi:AsmA-like C-terminal region-containing protein [Aquimarina pacifica]|uniref:AsmA-like C-terminal region-containing protein n=1 Tax=Aquimarina pacifica TaxID=1296415 RepID=UPI0004723F7A|nr:AsmA-like C-terminal region-containing protein [Aquimarina pacifica]